MGDGDSGGNERGPGLASVALSLQLAGFHCSKSGGAMAAQGQASGEVPSRLALSSEIRAFLAQDRCAHSERRLRGPVARGPAQGGAGCTRYSYICSGGRGIAVSVGSSFRVQEFDARTVQEAGRTGAMWPIHCDVWVGDTLHQRWERTRSEVNSRPNSSKCARRSGRETPEVRCLGGL